jgi:hypothetical protein
MASRDATRVGFTAHSRSIAAPFIGAIVLPPICDKSSKNTLLTVICVGDAEF